MIILKYYIYLTCKKYQLLSSFPSTAYDAVYTQVVPHAATGQLDD